MEEHEHRAVSSREAGGIASSTKCGWGIIDRHDDDPGIIESGLVAIQDLSI